MASTTTVQIQAFESHIHGFIILCQGPYRTDSYPNISEYINRPREPFKRKLLLASNAASISKIVSPPYNAIIVPNESIDWTVALTYIHYSPKPTLVCIEDIQVPNAFFCKLRSIKNITIIHNMTTSLVQSIQPYDCVFFSAMERTTSEYAKYVFKQLQTHYKNTYTHEEYTELVSELVTEDAGLVWINRGEKTSAGSLYWYEPANIVTTDYFTRKQLSDFFGILSSQFKHGSSS